MQNELKPCPFCGGKPHLYYHDSEIYWTEWYVDCKACGYRMRNKAVGDKTALLEAKKAWNTRQPVDNWKPIEELSKEPLTSISDLVLYNRNSGIYVIPNIWVIEGIVLISEYAYENKRSIENIQELYTHYFLLTPPKE